MRSSTLVARIARLIETAGESSGGGEALANEYAAAVDKVNSRLDAVIAAADAKSIGDAIRLLSEDPPLLEEVSTLDFLQLQDWESLCDMNGWTVPPKIDRKMTERAVEIGDAKDAIEPFLAMYKKAVRIDNVRLAVKSLRRLFELDNSQDWSRNLRQSERRLQSLIIEEFRAARRAGNEESCDALAHELLDTTWLDGASAKGVDEVREYRACREAEQRNAEGMEDVAILKKCLAEKWDRKLALSLVRAIDGFVEKGWRIPDDDKCVVDECRARCAREFEQEEMERRWREVNEALHAAIQKEDSEAIRNALSAPEFLDRDPMDGMLSQAQTMLDHAEAARRRKTFQIAVVSFVGILAVLGVSAWWLRQKLLIGRCADEAERFAYFEKQAKERPRYAIDNISSRLAKLRDDDPDVYADPKVNSFEARLKAIIAENDSRTNQIATSLVELETMRDQAWTNGVEAASITGRLNRIESLLAKDDDVLRSRYLSVKDSWLDYVGRIEKASRERATKFHATLVSHLKTIAARLTTELAKKDLNVEVDNCKASLEEWKNIHSGFAEDLSGTLAEAEKSFNDALEEQHAYTNALEKLNVSKDAADILEARKDLAESFGGYPDTKLLKPLPFAVSDVKDILSPEPMLIKMYLDSMRGGLSREEFENFINDNVLIIADTPSYYSLYGLKPRKSDERISKIVAVSVGRPQINKPTYDNEFTIKNKNDALVRFDKRSVVSEIKSGVPVEDFMMPSSAEMHDVVDFVKGSSITDVSFENKLVELIDKHIRDGRTGGTGMKQDGAAYYLEAGKWNPYIRVHFVAMYMRWLKDDMKVMPKDDELERWCEEFDRLANPVNVEEVEDNLAWLCVWEVLVRKRLEESHRLLKKVPEDWARRYKAKRLAQRELLAIGGWKVMCAGKVMFDPLDPKFDADPGVVVVSAPNIEADHPLYVLRRIEGRLVLVRAFEPGRNAPWRKCAEVGNASDGYLLGEPLFHVFARGKFIDVQAELSEMARRTGASTQGGRLARIPLFSNGGK